MQRFKIVLYGDSICEVGRTPDWYGGASCMDMNWGQQLGQMLRGEFPQLDIVVEHFGIGGQNAYEGAGRLDWLKPYAPDLVLLAFGANDCGYHYLLPEETGAAVGWMINGIGARHGAAVIVIGPACDNPLAPITQHRDETIAAIAAVAAAHEVPYVDMRAAVLEATENGARWEDLHNGPADCHPNDRGMAVWAAGALPAVRAHLQQRFTGESA